MQRTGLQSGLGLVNGGLGALGSHGGVELGKLDGTGGDGAGVVSVDGLAVHRGGNGVDIVGHPVDAGGDNVGVGSHGDGAAVIGDVGHTGGLAGGGGAEGVGVLGNQNAAALNQLVGAFLLGGLIIPGTGEGNIHGHGGNDGANAQEEGGIAGDHLGIGEGAHVADLGVGVGDFAGLHHGLQLHTGGNTGQVAALIDGGESIVVVGQALGVGAGAGGMAELNIGILFGSLNHVVLMTEAVSEHDLAAAVRHIGSGLVALLAFGYVGLQNVFDAKLLAGFLCSVDEVQVISGVFVVQGDKTDFEGGRGLLAAFIGGCGSLGGAPAAGNQGQGHDQGENQCKKLLHSFFLL